MAKMRIDFDYSEKERTHLVGLATKWGFKREDPKKAWTDRERDEAVRFVIKKLVDVSLTD